MWTLQENFILPFYTTHENAYFLQNGELYRRAKAVRKWVGNWKPSAVDFVPGHSPNLNLIENVWNYMKRNIGKIPVQEKIRTLWADVDP